jgi:hypothetical protein
MNQILVKPHYWTEKEDEIILNLFDCVCTSKLSILMGIETKFIVARSDFLLTQKRNKPNVTKRSENNGNQNR